jgi:hypothetical protein
MRAPVGTAAAAGVELGADCVAHARMFFNRPDFDLANAAPGGFALMPHDDMVDQLRTDYRAMTGMIFGEPRAFEDVVASVKFLEKKLYASAGQSS